MSRIVSAHQPNFIPYLGFFDKMKKADIFVIRDEVLFIRKEYHNRNRIRINSHDNLNFPNFKWISVPVYKTEDYIKHIKIKNSPVRNRSWNEIILHEIESSYSSADLFDRFFSEIRGIFSYNYCNLLELNVKIINFLKEAFGIKTRIVLASELGLKKEHYEKSDASEDLIEICKKLNADIYLSGAGGKEYLNLEPFERKGIKVEFQEYKHPVYEQHLPGFLPNMAAIDALFCVGRMPESEIKIEVDNAIQREIFVRN